MAQINQFSVEAASLSNSDYLGVDKLISPGVFQTQKVRALSAGFAAKPPGNFAWNAGDLGNVSQFFTTELYDVDSAYNNSNGTYTAPVAGKYLFSGRITPNSVQSSGGNGAVQIDFSYNGTGGFGAVIFNYGSDVSAIFNSIQTQQTFVLALGDTVRLNFSVQTPNGLTIVAGSEFFGHRIG